jgi:hypothetical protein
MRWNPTNPSTVIGRYAYTIYNEGGLLDANVAGYPTNLISTSFPKLAYKSGVYFADLTQIGLTNAQINALIGWRNKNSVGSGGTSGSYPSYSISATGATNYASNAMARTNFLTAYTNSSGSDLAFTSRQQLISFLINADSTHVTNALQSLQSLGTFSRSQNRPTSWPDPTRAKEIAPNYQTNWLTVGSLGNSAGGKEDAFNPPFPTIRVTTPFTRNDGTGAQVGDPLVKSRFQLNRLCWITADGPSKDYMIDGGNDATLVSAYTGAGVSTNLLSQGTANNITKYFGLTWNIAFPRASNDRNGWWTYSHGVSGIATLAQVAALGRDPDFFELLKASINPAAIAQPVGGDTGSAGFVNSSTNRYLLYVGSSVDRAILQIGANIINQASPDDYPRMIVFQEPGTSLTLSCSGIVDLPYFYGNKDCLVMVRDATPSSGTTYQSINNINFGTNQYVTTSTNGLIAYTNTNAAFTKLTDGGCMALVTVPLIWNPHAPPATASSIAPTQLRIWLTGNLPPTNSSSPTPISYSASILPYQLMSVRTSSTNSTNIFFYHTASGSPPLIATNSNNVPFPPSLTNIGTYDTTRGLLINGGTEDNSLYFANSKTLYREPTPLARPNIPAGSSLTISNSSPLATTKRIASNMTGATNGTAYGTTGLTQLNAGATNLIGFYIAEFPVRWQETNTFSWTVSGSNYTTKITNIYTVNGYGSTNSSGNDYQCTISLEYNAGNNVWVPYQQHVAQAAVGASVSWSSYWSNALSSNNWIGGGPLYIKKGDPRNSLWWGENASPKNVLNGSSIDFVNYSSADFCFTGNNANDFGIGNNYNNPMAASENMFMVLIDRTAWGGLGSGNTTKKGIWLTNGFHTCPDGIVRRGMGGWMTPGTAPITPGSDSSPTGMLSNNTGNPMVNVWTNYPMDMAHANTNTVISRPIILHRPFRNVGELSYVLSDSPWRNLDCMTPESGFTALFDTFCINDSGDANGLVAGKVDLNTRQTNVLAAILSGAYRDEYSISSAATTTEATNIAAALIARTTNTATLGKGPIWNTSQLVGRWIGSGAMPATNSYCYSLIPPSHDGFSADLGGLYTGTTNNIIPRYRETAMRALLDSGQAGTWNLLIDVVAQTGKYPSTASSLDRFLVEGEKRFWVHVAIDRLTGKVLDESIEPVTE